MITQDLINYIKNQQQLGKTKDEITAALKVQGWQDADIEQGFSAAASGAPAPVPAPGNQLPKARQIFSEAWILYKSRMKTLVTINVIPTLGFFAFGTIAALGLITGKDLPQSTRLPLIAAGALVFLVMIYLTIWATMAMLYAIKDHEENIGVAEAFKRGKPKIWALFITGLLAGLAVLGGLILLIIPGIIFGFWFSQYPYVVLEEDLSASAALSRSKYYVKGRIGQVFGKLFYIALITLGLSILVSILQAILSSLGTSAGLGTDVATSIQAAVKMAFNLIWTPVTTVFGYLLFKHMKATRP